MSEPIYKDGTWWWVLDGDEEGLKQLTAYEIEELRKDDFHGE